MTNTLQQHFPMIRERQEILTEIQSRRELNILFRSWEEKYQQEFLDFCSGVRGVRLLYDSFFKALMNPGITPERMEELLSNLLCMQVKILKVLPNDSTRIAAESSLLIMDVVVELEDGSIANVEVQRIGYAFPGQRSACYSADLLLRQYKRVKGEKGKKFSYRDIKKVYTIVLFEKSSAEFHRYPEQYIHRMKQKSDTGIQIDLLQEYIFVSLDNFRKIQHNENGNIKNELEAWLTFLSVDEPEMIIRLIKKYPKFKLLYREVYEMCRNLEDIMGIFSKELEELDKNTVQYMIDEMQDEIDGMKGVIDSQTKALEEKEGVIDSQTKKLEEQRRRIEQLESQVAEKK